MKILVLSDIHGNWPALRAVLEAESGVDEILCLGDLVDYGPQPLECLEWAVQALPAGWLLQGNHDWGVGWNKDPRCSPPYRHLTEVTKAFCLEVLAQEHRAFLRVLSPIRSFSLGGAKCVACHATPSDPLFRYLRLNGGNDPLEKEIEIAEHPDFLFFGHTHWPMVKCSGGTKAVNPGSVGQPKDGDPRAAYAVWDDGEVSLRRAAYDIDETIRAYAKTSIPERDAALLGEVLRSGGNLPAAATTAQTT